MTPKMVALKDVCHFVRGVGFEKHEARSTSERGCLPILRAGNIQKELDTVNDLVWVPRQRVSEDQILRPGDVAVCLSSGSPAVVGKTAQLRSPFGGSVGAFCGIIRPRDPESAAYLGYWFRSADYYRWRDDQARGANIQNLRFSNLESVTITWPPIAERRLIVKRLNEQMAAAEKIRMATAAQFEAARALPCAIYRDSFRKIVPLDLGSRKNGAPPGWKWHKLSDLARLESGHTPSRNHPEWWGGDVPWIGLSDIRALDGTVALATREYTNDLGLANSSSRLLPKDTVALCRTASVGCVTILGRPMATSQHFANWVCGPELDPTFLLHLFQASRGRLNELASGTTIQDIYMNTIKDFHVCVPCLDEQRSLAARLSEHRRTISKLCMDLELKLAALNRLPGTILARAFAGEI